MIFVLPALARFKRASQRLRTIFVSRAGEGTRTLDNQLGRLELYQLSYTRILLCEGSSPIGSFANSPKFFVEGGGFEPPKA